MKSQFCPRCGRGSPSDAKFCPACGSPRWVEGTDPFSATLVAGRYRLLDKIDESAVGLLYRAEDLQLERPVAVRLFDPALTLDEVALERARAEMHAMAASASEYLVRLFDFGRTSEGRLFVAMESTEGESLRAVLDHEVQLAVPRVIDILQQIAEALSGPHAGGWIHGDLRPRNVLLVSRGARGGRGSGKDFVRLLDFGLAQLVLSGARPGMASTRLTYGDPHYMAPEQMLGEPVDGRVDLHSIGVLGYEMLVGERPFTGAHPGEALERLLATVRPSIRGRRPECPEWLDALLQRAMARRPEERFSSIDQLLGYLSRGGEATPVALVAERVRSGDGATSGRTSDRRESAPGARALVGDPVIVQPEGGPGGGPSVPVPAEPEMALTLAAPHTLPATAAAGPAALAVAVAVGRTAEMNAPAGRAANDPESSSFSLQGEGNSGSEGTAMTRQAKGDGDRVEEASLAALASESPKTVTPAATEKAMVRESSGPGHAPKAEGRPRGEPTDQFWFNAEPATLALGEEEYADEGTRRNLGPLIGLIVGGALLLVVLVIGLWPRNKTLPRAGESSGTSAAPAGQP
jgi:hypothetical protein